MVALSLARVPGGGELSAAALVPSPISSKSRLHASPKLDSPALGGPRAGVLIRASWVTKSQGDGSGAIMTLSLYGSRGWEELGRGGPVLDRFGRNYESTAVVAAGGSAQVPLVGRLIWLDGGDADELCFFPSYSLAWGGWGGFLVVLDVGAGLLLLCCCCLGYGHLVRSLNF